MYGCRSPQMLGRLFAIAMLRELVAPVEGRSIWLIQRLSRRCKPCSAQCKGLGIHRSKRYLMKRDTRRSHISAPRSKYIEAHGALCTHIPFINQIQRSSRLKSIPLAERNTPGLRLRFDPNRTNVPRSGGRCSCAHQILAASAGFPVVIGDTDQARHCVGMKHNCKHDDQVPECDRRRGPPRPLFALAGRGRPRGPSPQEAFAQFAHPKGQVAQFRPHRPQVTRHPRAQRNSASKRANLSVEDSPRSGLRTRHMAPMSASGPWNGGHLSV